MILIVIIIIVILGPPLFFLSLGNQTKDKQKAKLFYIIAVVYLIIGFGVCGTLMNGF